MKNKLDLEIMVYFSEAYHRLWEEGKITREEHDQAQDLLDNLEQLPPDLLKEKLETIFEQKNNRDS